ncbi:Cilia- and flagella-associated protein 43 [Nowakowskiella sp. JEL0407]|nr:Cilia- and flagella-associated protein 43 [Nowakowskiella sp. JEL0407]
MSSLYGELGGGHSFGLSLQHVEYISNNHFVYASGNHLNVVDTKTLSDANNQTTEPHPKTKTPFPDVNSVIDHKSAENPNSEGAIENDQTTDGNNEARHSFSQPAISTRLKPFVLESDVTAFACYRRGSVIAVAESGSTNIKILKWPSGAQLGVLQAYPDISINSLSFSFDGQYLAVLGSLPTFQVSVWDWRSATMICSSSNELPANQVSFNPGNSNQLCTSGLDGGVKFWQINIGFKKNNLTFTQGSLCPSIETYANEKMNMVSLFHGNKGFITEQFDAFKITPKIHAWRVDQQVLCTTSDGDLIVQYNPVSAECNVVLSAKRHFGQKTETNLNKNSGKPQKTATDTVISTLLGNDGTDEEKNNEFEIREFKDGFAECGNNMNHIIVGKDYIAVGGKDGNVRIIKADGEMVPYVASVVSVSNFPVSALCVSPDYQEILVVTEKRNIFCYKIFSGEVFLAVNNDTGYIIAADISKLTGLLATAHSNGVLRFWDTETTSTLGVITIPATLSFLSMSPFSTVVAVGSQHGVLRIYDTSTILTTTPKLIFREKIHDGVITQGSFNYSGSLLATISNDGRVCLTDLKTTFRTIRFIRLSHGLPVSVLWSSEDPGEDLSMSLRLFVLTVNDKQKNSCVHRFQYPEDDQLDNFSGEIPNSKMPVVMYQFEEELSDFVVLPKHFSSGRKSFYVCGKDRKLKLYVAPQQKTQSKPQLEETILMEAASSEYLDHEKSSVHVRLSHLRDWAITWAPDGVITLRTLLDPEKMLKIPAHDSRFGGVKDVCLTIDARTIVSIGGDSILKIWEWNYSAAGRRAATDANGNGEQIIAGQEAMIAEFAEKINLTLV